MRAVETLAVRPEEARPPYPVRRWSVAEYHQLGELGILSQDDRVELLEGWIVPKMTHYPPHAFALTQLQQRLGTVLGVDWYLRIQLPIETQDSEPEPDVVIVRSPPERYLDRHSGATDVGLVVEVADSSIRRDRRKARIYAGAGVATYWIVNVLDRQIEVHTEPDTEHRQFHTIRILAESDVIALTLDGAPVAEFTVAAFLPPVRN